MRPIAKYFRPILIFFARDDAKLMPGEVCQVSCQYSNKWRSYSEKNRGGGVGFDPPGGGGLRKTRGVDKNNPPATNRVNHAYDNISS